MKKRQSPGKKLQKDTQLRVWAMGRENTIYIWLRALAEGCRTHPWYRAGRHPGPDCADCLRLWETAQRLRSIRELD